MGGNMKCFIRGRYIPIQLCLLFLFCNIYAQNGAWRVVDMLPSGRAAATAELVDGKIYLIGGSQGAPNFTELAANQMYDPIGRYWQTKTPMPTPRSFLASAAVDDTIYVLGGSYPEGRTLVEAYISKEDKWVRKQDMPLAISTNQACTVNGLVYAIGGADGKRYCLAYDPKTDKWTVKTPMPGHGGVVSLTVYNGLIYVFGGTPSPEGPAYNTVYVYNPQTDTWTRKKDMPTARFAFHSYLVNGKIYAIGGCQRSYSSISAVEVYDPEADTWDKRYDMPFRACFYSGAVLNGKIYIMAGTPDWASAVMDVWEYDPEAPIELTTQSIDFKAVHMGSTSTPVTVKLTNRQNKACTISSVSASLPDFVVSGQPSLPAVIPPSGELEFSVSFRPAHQGKVYDVLNIFTDIEGYNYLYIALEGEGLLFGPVFRKLYDSVTAAPYSMQKAIVDSFLAHHTKMPLIEQDSICQFIYRGSVSSVSMAGDANYWDMNASPMHKLLSTNLWYYSAVYPPDARLEYKFVVNGSTWTIDPLNPRIAPGEYQNSDLIMPAYRFPPELKYYADIPHGVLHDTVITSNKLGNTRKIWVYTPPLYYDSPEVRYALALFHDGGGWVNSANVQNSLDYLINKDYIRPLIAVFVPPVQRHEEYIGDKQENFIGFISEELMPYIDRRYRTEAGSEHRATLGISNSGNIAMLIALRLPGMFTKGASFSGYITPSTLWEFEDYSPSILKLYVDAGTYDLSGFCDLSKSFCQILHNSGCSHMFNEWHEGHNWGSWGAHLDDALEYLLPGSAVGVEEQTAVPVNYELGQNYPNPFNPSTTIEYSLAERSYVSLKVYDILGRQVAVLFNEEQAAGKHKAQWNATGYQSGIYFCRLRAAGYTRTIKMILLR